jgi:hypothetical protein
VRKLFSSGSGKGGGLREFRKKYPFAGGIVYFSPPVSQGTKQAVKEETVKPITRWGWLQNQSGKFAEKPESGDGERDISRRS